MIRREFNLKSDWIAWRHDGVGGSDVGKLYNVSRYGDYNSLLDEKLATKPKSIDLWGPIQIQAQVTEQNARQGLGQYLDTIIDPVNLESKSHPELRVSLDGWHEGMAILMEHKMMGKLRRENATKWLKEHEHFMAGINEGSPIQEECYQMAYQAILTRPKFVFLIVSDYKTGAMKVYRNEFDGQWADVGQDVVKKVLDFWKVVQCKRQASI